MANGGSLGDLYSKCVQMVNENKVTTKNAWDLNLIEHMDDIVDSFMGGTKQATREAEKLGVAAKPARKLSKDEKEDAEVEHRFHEASATIEASARIYACRVDCVHTDTYRILGGLTSADMDEDAEGKEGEGAAKKKRRICGVNTLERNEANITQQNVEADDQSDPMFRRMAADFDAGGAKGLLLSKLPTAEDLSLVFNGDVPIARATTTAEIIFSQTRKLQATQLFGDPAAFCSKISGTRLCPEVDGFRRQLWGDVAKGFSLPDSLEQLLGPAAAGRPLNISHAHATAPAPLMDQNDVPDVPEPADPFMDGGDCMPMDDSMPSMGGGMGGGMASAGPPVSYDPSASMLPLADADAPLAQGSAGSSEDAIAFDELFKKFCGKGEHQFKYFDEAWAPRAREKDGTCAIDDGLVDDIGGGQLVPADAPEPREKAPKRPLFDLSSLDKPVKPIETEPSHKHQLSEKAAQWQLHKDVPPYMIDRITMPSWPTWSKCDFACLGLRPHLMLKLVRKQPPGDGPHTFAELFSTVVVENPDAYPWLNAGSQKRAAERAREEHDEQDGRADRDIDQGADVGDYNFDASGLPPHLDVNEQDLFLNPDDKVVMGGDDDGEDAYAGVDGGCAFEDNDDDFGRALNLDIDLADRPQVCGSTDIGYSRNSKFVDVKLVKKHLWDMISEDISAAKAADQSLCSSFKDLSFRVADRMSKGETENLSVAVSFICALHLCNEKNIEMDAEGCNLGDFKVTDVPKVEWEPPPVDDDAEGVGAKKGRKRKVDAVEDDAEKETATKKGSGKGRKKKTAAP